MRVFENSVLRRIFGPERDGVTREWGRLPYFSIDNARVIYTKKV